jgi:alkanesulfonate monooxygenase SsuD/methylene tetrahydromethanopterin reductase-like flavin-dependent oxidoreductase (luciferase family)
MQAVVLREFGGGADSYHLAARHARRSRQCLLVLQRARGRGPPRGNHLHEVRSADERIRVAPHPALAAAAVAMRVRRAKIAMIGHNLTLNNPIKVAEDLAMLDTLSDGRLVVGFLRGTAERSEQGKQ